jgi:hypothetical protein
MGDCRVTGKNRCIVEVAETNPVRGGTAGGGVVKNSVAAEVTRLQLNLRHAIYDLRVLPQYMRGA